MLNEMGPKITEKLNTAQNVQFWGLKTWDWGASAPSPICH